MSNPTERVNKKGLGRGLGSLLSGLDDEAPTQQPPPVRTVPVVKQETTVGDGAMQVPKIPPEARIWQIDIDKIVGNKNQPRKIFDETPLKSLAASIKEKGILQPIVVRKLEGDQFEIIAGERRWRAAQLAGLHRVPVILKTTDDQNSLELALIENIQRQNLNAIEEAQAYQYLIEKFELTQQELADRVGKERASIANSLRLLNLNYDVRDMVSAGEISFGQAKALLAINDGLQQKKIALKVRNDRMSVRATERLVAKWKRGDGDDGSSLSSTRHISALAADLQRLLGTKVYIQYMEGKGRLTIQFFSDDELNGLVDRIRRSCQK